MTKTNKILLAVLGVLLLIAAVMGGAIAARSGLFGSGDDIAQPYNETRYSGTIENAEGLIEAADPVPVVLVVRFHDNGETGELTSPTLKRHSMLTRTDEHTYREEIVHGEGVDAGDSGVEWTFEPNGEDDAMGVSYTTSDGASASAELPQTDQEETSGEVGINPEVAGAEPDGIEFPEHSYRSTGTIELVHADDPSKNISDEVIFRISQDATTHTVAYPGRGCYGTVDSTDPNIRVENITVGDCESGGTWKFTGGDASGGSAEFTSADGKLTGSLNFHAGEWDDIDGEIGIARSGPVLDFYEEFTAEDSGAGKKKSAEEGDNSRQAREAAFMMPWGYGELLIGMSEKEATELGLDSGSVAPAENGIEGCTTATYSKLGVPEATVYLENGVISAIRAEGGNGYFENEPIHSWKPGDDFNIVPGHEPETEKSGEWSVKHWYLEGGNGNILHVRLFTAESQTTFTAYTPDTSCKG